MADEPEIIEGTEEELLASIEASQAAAAAEAEAAQAAPPQQEETPPAEVPAAEPAEEPFTYTAADGTTYKAETSEALFKKVTDALNMTKAAVKDREYQIHDLKRTPPAETPKEQSFDKSTYFNLLEADPIKAAEYVKGFDPDIKQLRESNAAAAERARVAEEARKFTESVPEFSVIAATNPEINTAIAERMREKGRSYTADAIGFTYYELRAEGKIKPAAPGEAVSRKAPPPVSPAGRSADAVEGGDNFDDMSAKEMLEYLKKKGTPGADYLQVN